MEQTSLCKIESMLKSENCQGETALKNCPEKHKKKLQWCLQSKENEVMKLRCSIMHLYFATNFAYFSYVIDIKHGDKNENGVYM